jgi:hypothetical protein
MSDNAEPKQRSTWTVEHKPGFAAVVSVDLKKEFWVLLRSDAHWDNPDSNRNLMKKHLEQAKQRNAAVLDFGDLFCAMQGKYDRRSNKDKVRPEHQSGQYLDKLVDTAVEWHAPYAHLWAAQYSGNHETSILAHHETCLLTRLAEGLRQKTGAVFPLVGYTGFVKFNFQGNKRQSCTLWGIHGYGGGGPVTKDMIQRARQQQYVDADIYVSGHTHDQFTTPDMRVGITQAGRIETRRTTYVKLPSYKDEYKQGQGGYHVEKGRPPKPVGAMWLRFWMVNSGSDKRYLRWEVREALL